MNEQTKPKAEILGSEPNVVGPASAEIPGSEPNVADQENPGSEPIVVEQAGGGVEPAHELVPDPGAFDSAPDINHVKRVLEAALLSSTEPLTVQQLKRLFGGQVDADNIRKVLDELKDEWAERSIELTTVASGWRFRVKPQYQEFLDRITHEKPPRYSRAVLETLAIIAYRQPVTRGDIEEVRGVAVSPPTLKALEERGWIETVGHRETPGRPALFATTRKFLDDLNLRSLEELPPLDELQSALEPVPTLAGIEAAPTPPEQDCLIADEPETTTESSENNDPEESQSHAG